MAKFKLDPIALPTLGAAEAARLDAMTDDEITAAALSDPDNPPLDAEELARIAAARHLRAVRNRTGLSQSEFARAFHINVARLRSRASADPSRQRFARLFEGDRRGA
jgi:putative transcriptional regulator